MPVKANLIVNCDDALLFWKVTKPIPGCLGFAIDRERTLPNGATEKKSIDNRMGFKADKPKLGEHRPSTEWPFQRLWWTDHEVNLGDTVRYRVCPMVKVGNELKRLEKECSSWTPLRKLGGDGKEDCTAYFNRGLVISQFMARYLESLRKAKGLANRKEALKAFRDSLDEHELPIRKFLSGALRDKMLDVLVDAKKNGKKVFAALYELEDEELVAALAALGAKAHVVLANGSITKKTGETAVEARKRDQNKVARKALRAAGVEVHDRFISPGALGHNKFLVVCKANGTPEATWTGSTNWTATGLCTQTNNGLLVKHRGFSAEFFEQWERLRDAGSEFPAELVDSNSVVKTIKAAKLSADIWFTRTAGGVDLSALDDEINAAKDGVLFLMFQPGGSGALKTIRDLSKAKPNLYVHGVVSTLPSENGDDESETEVSLQNDDKKRSLSLDIVQPRGTNAFANWAATVARHEFLKLSGGVIGYAIVHSKVIVIDPFSNPVVITGSHNFSSNASKKNDENFVVIRGNKALAASYAAHIMSVYDHYRWLALLGEIQGNKNAKQLSGYLAETDAWLPKKLKSEARELAFWVR
jgi:phosphatidylserine/phosphatidylglycerophosphate/cardiolipin synthase-like enzyme